MTNSRRVPTIGLVLLLLALPMVAQEEVGSEDAEAQTAAGAADDLSALLAKVKATDTEILDMTRKIPEAEGEELTILQTRFSELESEQSANLYQLLDLIDERERSGADVTVLDQQAEQLLNRLSRRLRTRIQKFEERLQQRSLERETLSPSELQDFEHQMAIDTDRLDHLYLDLIKLSEEKSAVGISVVAEQDFLAERLAARGQNLLEVLQLANKQLDGYRDLLKTNPDDGDLQARVFAAEERIDSNKTALLATIHMMGVMGLDYTDLEVRALELTHEVTPEALEAEVALGFLEHEFRKAGTYLKNNGPRLLLRVLLIVAILVITWILARLARNLTKRALDRTRIAPSELLREMAVRWVGRIVIIVGLVIVLSQLGINLGPVLAGFGIAGIVIGFALQDTLSNFAAGAMILAYRPFDVGDLIETAGVLGKVDDMNLVSTRIMTVDHQTLVVPNSKIWGDVIRNVTAQTTRRVDMVFGISYEDEIPKAERVLKEIVDGHDKVLDDPEPVIKLHTLNDSSVDFIVRPWARTEDYWDVYWDITREVKMRFDREGISIPFPQRDVHLFSPDAEENS